MKKTFSEKFGSELMFFDGSMGTFLQREGLKTGELPEEWCFSHPDTVRRIHRAYIDAGCDVISTDTFGANRYKAGLLSHSVADTVSRAVSIAREAVRESDTGRDVFVALSAGPMGKLLSPLGELPFEEAVSAFAETVAAARDAGVDLILFETFSDPYEMKAAVLAAKETAPEIPVIVTMMPDKNCRLLSGGETGTACVMLEALGVCGIGLNCGEGPEQFLRALPSLMKYASVPVLCSPNAGLPSADGGKTVFKVTPEEFATAEEKFVAMGVSAVGGCCGTDDTHISASYRLLHGRALNRRTHEKRTLVSSRSRVTDFAAAPLVIGERINPTGKPLFKEALKRGDTDYILLEAKKQVDAGADILDVNVGLPGIDEAVMLTAAVAKLQAVAELPLQLDTSNGEALEKALRIYNGKPLINSVNGTEESMARVFPLMKKYGGVAVCLAMDGEGIPDTAEKRFAVIEKIAAKAAEYGIGKNDLVADGLVTSAATDRGSAEVTLDTIKLVKKRLGIGSVLGISNISFGLPERDRINAAFFGLAVENGLSAGIVNPLSEAIMAAKHNRAGSDFGGIIDTVMPGAPQTPVQTGKNSLSMREAVVSGIAGAAAEEAKRLLETRSQMEIITSELIPALDEVGSGFEKGTLYLPQLLMAADAAKAAFEVIRASYSKREGSRGDRIVLATVKGDIHDIGKNIVKSLLENYGFDVIDLGKNVEPQAVLDAVVKDGVKLAGLSALMTTTVVSMEETIALLKEKAPFCRVMVGGAVLTEEYARAIGADFYAKDAVASVRYAQSLFGKSGDRQ